MYRYRYHICLIYSLVDRNLGGFHTLAIVKNLGGFHTLAIVNNAAVNIGVHISFEVSAFIFFG